MSDVFLSYASADRPRVTVLAQVLERAGFSVWWDRQILPGSSWERVIEAALEAARCVVVVWTKASVLSDWVRIEAALGRERGILAPVFFEQVPLPIAFRQIQTASLVGWEGAESHAGLTGLRAGIQAILSGPAHVDHPTSTTEQRALDAAISRQLPVHHTADLITMVRRADSTGLKGILAADDEYGLSPEDVVSKPIDLTFPRDPAGRTLPADILMRVRSPGFDPSFQEKRIRVQPNRDSTVCSFLLRPLEVGDLILQLELYQNDVCVASRLLRVLGLAEVPGEGMAMGFQIVSVPLRVNVTRVPVSPLLPAAPPASKVKPVVGWLVCLEGPERGRDYPLRSGENTVGRAPSMDVCIADDQGVARDKHFVIKFDQATATFWLQPGEAGRPILLNSESVASPRHLKAHDRIEVGLTKLVFIPFCDGTRSWSP